MNRRIGSMVLLAAGMAFLPVGKTSAQVEIKSKAVAITITGRQHTQFNTTSVEGKLGSEFLIRRARLTAEVKLNDVVSGKIQPDFGSGKLSLKDAYSKFSFGSRFKVYTGQFKRPFDLFELTSSTQILVVERAGTIRGASGFTSLSSLTEGLHYSDRDIGVKAALRSGDQRYGLDVAVTNGDGSNKVPSKLGADDYAVAEKQYTARAFVKPPLDGPLTLSAGITALPVAYADSALTAAEGTALAVAYATAFEVAAEWGDWHEGLHVQAGAVFGDNWSKDRASPPTFLAMQGIVTFRHALPGIKELSAIEPLIRVSWADPDTGTDADAGLLITPGVQIFFIGRSKFAVNLDIFSPQSESLDTEYSIKAQASLHF